MMMRMQAMLSESGEMILQFSMMELRILLGLSSASSLLYFSAMKSVWVGRGVPASRKGYHLVDAHRLEDAVGRQQDEVVPARVQVVGHHVRDAAQVALQLPLHVVLVVLRALPSPSPTLYSNCPKQRESVHLPIRRSYWMKPPAFSIRSRSSPLLCILPGLPVGGRG